MTATRNVFARLMKQLTKPSTTTKRVVSTSTATQHGVTSLDIDVAKCPLEKTAGDVESKDASLPRNDVSTITEVKPFEKMPGPKGWPIIGTLLDYLKKDGLKFSKMFEAYQQRAEVYGPVYYEHVGNFDAVVVSDPAEYNKLMRAEGKYPDRRVLEPWAYYRQYKGLDAGLVNANGDEWYNMRTVVSKKILRLHEITKFSEDMGEVADDFVVNLTEMRDGNQEVTGLEQELFKWAMESAGSFIFEERLGCLNKEPTPTAKAFIDNLVGFFKYMQPLMYNLPFYKYVSYDTWNKFEYCTDNVVNIGKQIVIKKIRALENGDKNQKSDFLSHLLYNENSKNDCQRRHGIGCGHHDGSCRNSSTWTLYCLAKHPEVQERLYQEIQQASQDGTPLTNKKLSNLPYAKSILKETLRLYPIVYSTSRHAETDIEIGGYNVPKGTHVQANLYGMYRNPDLYPDPSEFKPERWLKENKMEASTKALSNLVWGHGARMCIGRRLAEQELHIIMTKIVQKFHLSYSYDDALPVLNTMLTPDKLIKIQFTTRN